MKDFVEVNGSHVEPSSPIIGISAEIDHLVAILSLCRVDAPVNIDEVLGEIQHNLYSMCRAVLGYDESLTYTKLNTLKLSVFSGFKFPKTRQSALYNLCRTQARKVAVAYYKEFGDTKWYGYCMSIARVFYDLM